MSRYHDIKSSNLLSDLQPVDSDTLARIGEQYPGVPDDFVEFLRDIGAGDWSGSLMLYNGLVDPEEIYGEPLESAQVVLFADDYQGFGIGFDLEDWTVVEVDPTEKSVRKTHASFEDFVRQFIHKPGRPGILPGG